MLIEDGMVVTLDFELRDAQGEIIQEHGGDPIVYLHGGEFEVFPKLQEELSGKALGDEVGGIEIVIAAGHHGFAVLDGFIHPPTLLRRHDQRRLQRLPRVSPQRRAQAPLVCRHQHPCLRQNKLSQRCNHNLKRRHNPL